MTHIAPYIQSLVSTGLCVLKNFVFYGVLILATPILAQQPGDKIYPQLYDCAYLEHLIKVKVDSVREAHGLAALVDDSTLYVAAAFHGKYLKRKGGLTHHQDDVPSMRTPQMRVAAFGKPEYRVGENLALNYINIPLRRSDGEGTRVLNTYQQVSWALVNAWVNSPGHYANMIAPNYQLTGVAVAVDTVYRKVIAVQKFAQVPFVYSFSVNQRMFPYADTKLPDKVTSFEQVVASPHAFKHAYKTIAPRTQDSDKLVRANEIIDARLHTIQLDYRGRKVYLVTWSSEMLYQFLNMHRKNKIALEFVPFEPYACGNPAYYTAPSRRNGQCIYSGIISKPKGRRELLRGFKRNRHKRFRKAFEESPRNLFRLGMGKVPEHIGPCDVNVLFFYRNQLVRVMHLTTYCGSDSLGFDLEELPKGLLHSFPEEYRDFPGANRVQFDVALPFAQGQRTLNEQRSAEPLDSLVQFLSNQKIQVDTVVVRAYSSLEGNRKENLALQAERCESIGDVIAGYAEGLGEVNCHCAENWEMMQRQIASSESLAHLRGLIEDEVIAAINAEPGRYESWLAEQRRADIHIIGKEQWTRMDTLDFLKRRFDSLLHTKDVDPAQRDRLLAQIYYTHARLVDFKRSAQLPWPAFLDRYPLLHECIYWIWLLHESDHWEDFDQQRELRTYLTEKRLDASSFQNEYNYFRTLLKLDPKAHDIHYTSLLNAFEESTWMNQAPSGFDEKADSLRLLLHVRSALQIIEEGRSPEDAWPFLDFIFTWYAQTGRISNETEALRVANFFLSFDHQPHAFNTIYPWVGDEHKDATILFAKLNYHHVEEEPDSRYFEWLIELQPQLGDRWCELFFGPCNIPFQIMDYEPLRNVYCDSCGDYVHYYRQQAAEATSGRDGQ